MEFVSLDGWEYESKETNESPDKDSTFKISVNKGSSRCGANGEDENDWVQSFLEAGSVLLGSFIDKNRVFLVKRYGFFRNGQRRSAVALDTAPSIPITTHEGSEPSRWDGV